MNGPLRIGVFVGAFPVLSETFILRQITGLLEQGHDVHVFANARGDLAVQHEAIARYHLLERTTFIEGPAESVLWEMPMRPVRGETWVPGAEDPVSNLNRVADGLPILRACAEQHARLTREVLDTREYGYRAASWSGACRLATLLRCKGGFDVLHAHFGPVGNAFRFARELFQAPLVVSFHGYDFSTIPRKEGPETYRKLWHTADMFLANSSYTRARLLALGCPHPKLVVLPVGLNLTDFPFRERERCSDEPVRLLTVARLTEIKGHAWALRALTRLAGIRFHYDIVGDGPLRQQLVSLTRELGLESCVTFHGARTEAEVRAFFQEAHIFLLTSANIEGDAEGQGLVLQEAQACGLPVVATQHGAFPEGIAPANKHWLVPERDADSLAAKLRELVAAHRRWPGIGRAGREFVERRYDIHCLNAQLIDLYNSARQRFGS